MKIINGILKLDIGREKGVCAYSLPIAHLGESISISYRTGVPELEPFFENVSRPIQHLLMTRNIERWMIDEIEKITKANFPLNDINWINTHLMVDYIKEFKSLFVARIREVSDQKNERFINVLDPVRMEKRIQVKTGVLKQLNDKYKPGMFCHPSVP